MYPECNCAQNFEATEYTECVPDVENGEWVFIPASEGSAVSILGASPIGSPTTELGRQDDEELHQVFLTHDFIILSTEVTQGFFEQKMGYQPSTEFFFNGPDYPVQNVSWHEAAAFCNELSQDEDLDECYRCTGDPPSVSCEPVDDRPFDCRGYRLPTEVEWEYAARIDVSAATPAGELDAEHLECEEGHPAFDSIAWFCGNAYYQPHEVAEKDPFDWHSIGDSHPYSHDWRHLHDMLGNVEEWCSDWYGEYGVDLTDPSGPSTGTERVHRGGSFDSQARDLRFAARGHAAPDASHSARGFRPVRSLDGFR